MVFTIWTHIVDIVPSLGNLKWSPMAGFFNSTPLKKNEKEITVPLIIPRSVLLVPPRSSFTLSLINSCSSLPVLITPRSPFSSLCAHYSSFRALFTHRSARSSLLVLLVSPLPPFLVHCSLSPRVLITPRSMLRARSSLPASRSLFTFSARSPRFPLRALRVHRSLFPSFTLSLINSRSSLPVLITPHSSFRALPVLITPRFSFRAIPCSALRAFRSTFNSPHSAFPRSLSPRALIIPRSSFSVQRSPAPHTLITPRSPLLVHRSERSSFPRFPS